MSDPNEDFDSDCPCCVEDETEEIQTQSKVEVLSIDQAQYARQAAKEMMQERREAERRGVGSEQRVRLDGEFYVLVKQEGRNLVAETITPLPHGLPPLRVSAERMDTLRALLHRRYADSLQVGQVVVDRMQAVHWASRARFPVADTVILAP